MSENLLGADWAHRHTWRVACRKVLIEEYRLTVGGAPLYRRLWLDPGPPVTFGTEIPIRASIRLPEEWALFSDACEIFEGARLWHNDQCRRPIDDEIDDWETLLFALWRWLPGFEIGACAETADAPFKTLGHDVAERYGRYWDVTENRLLHRATKQRYFGARFRYRPPPVLPARAPVNANEQALAGQHAPQSAESEAPEQPERRTLGRSPLKRNAVIAAMQKDLADNKLTRGDLYNMKEEEMSSRYGVSRDTCRKARIEVLSGIVEN